MLFVHTMPHLKYALCLKHWFSTRGNFAPRGTFFSAWKPSGYHDDGGGGGGGGGGSGERECASSIQWIEAMDAA